MLRGCLVTLENELDAVFCFHHLVVLPSLEEGLSFSMSENEYSSCIRIPQALLGICNNTSECLFVSELVGYGT